jgi:hypothetical protein
VPAHDIEITLPSKPLLNVDTTIVIKSDGQKLGELHISKGSLDWKSKSKQRGRSISWERVASLLDQETDQ